MANSSAVSEHAAVGPLPGAHVEPAERGRVVGGGGSDLHRAMIRPAGGYDRGREEGRAMARVELGRRTGSFAPGIAVDATRLGFVSGSVAVDAGGAVGGQGD